MSALPSDGLEPRDKRPRRPSSAPPPLGDEGRPPWPQEREGTVGHRRPGAIMTAREHPPESAQPSRLEGRETPQHQASHPAQEREAQRSPALSNVHPYIETHSSAPMPSHQRWAVRDVDQGTFGERDSLHQAGHSAPPPAASRPLPPVWLYRSDNSLISTELPVASQTTSRPGTMLRPQPSPVSPSWPASRGDAEREPSGQPPLHRAWQAEYRPSGSLERGNGRRLPPIRYHPPTSQHELDVSHHAGFRADRNGSVVRDPSYGPARVSSHASIASANSSTPVERRDAPAAAISGNSDQYGPSIPALSQRRRRNSTPSASSVEASVPEGIPRNSAFVTGSACVAPLRYLVRREYDDRERCWQYRCRLCDDVVGRRRGLSAHHRLKHFGSIDDDLTMEGTCSEWCRWTEESRRSWLAAERSFVESKRAFQASQKRPTPSDASPPQVGQHHPLPMQVSHPVTERPSPRPLSAQPSMPSPQPSVTSPPIAVPQATQSSVRYVHGPRPAPSSNTQHTFSMKPEGSMSPLPGMQPIPSYAYQAGPPPIHPIAPIHHPPLGFHDASAGTFNQPASYQRPPAKRGRPRGRGRGVGAGGGGGRLEKVSKNFSRGYQVIEFEDGINMDAGKTFGTGAKGGGSIAMWSAPGIGDSANSTAQTSRQGSTHSLEASPPRPPVTQLNQQPPSYAFVHERPEDFMNSTSDRNLTSRGRSRGSSARESAEDAFPLTTKKSPVPPPVHTAPRPPPPLPAHPPASHYVDPSDDLWGRPEAPSAPSTDDKHAEGPSAAVMDRPQVHDPRELAKIAPYTTPTAPQYDPVHEGRYDSGYSSRDRNGYYLGDNGNVPRKRKRTQEYPELEEALAMDPREAERSFEGKREHDAAFRRERTRFRTDDSYAPMSTEYHAASTTAPAYSEPQTQQTPPQGTRWQEATEAPLEASDKRMTRSMKGKREIWQLGQPPQTADPARPTLLPLTTDFPVKSPTIREKVASTPITPASLSRVPSPPRELWTVAEKSPSPVGGLSFSERPGALQRGPSPPIPPALVVSEGSGVRRPVGRPRGRPRKRTAAPASDSSGSVSPTDVVQKPSGLKEAAHLMVTPAIRTEMRRASKGGADGTETQPDGDKMETVSGEGKGEMGASPKKPSAQQLARDVAEATRKSGEDSEDDYPEPESALESDTDEDGVEPPILRTTQSLYKRHRPRKQLLRRFRLDSCGPDAWDCGRCTKGPAPGSEGTKPVAFAKRWRPWMGYLLSCCDNLQGRGHQLLRGRARVEMETLGRVTDWIDKGMRPERTAQEVGGEGEPSLHLQALARMLEEEDGVSGEAQVRKATQMAFLLTKEGLFNESRKKAMRRLEWKAHWA